MNAQPSPPLLRSPSQQVSCAAQHSLPLPHSSLQPPTRPAVVHTLSFLQCSNSGMQTSPWSSCIWIVFCLMLLKCDSRYAAVCFLFLLAGLTYSCCICIPCKIWYITGTLPSYNPHPNSSAQSATASIYVMLVSIWHAGSTLSTSAHRIRMPCNYYCYYVSIWLAGRVTSKHQHHALIRCLCAKFPPACLLLHFGLALLSEKLPYAPWTCLPA